MKVPKIIFTPSMGSIPTIWGALQLCRYWQEEAEWNGESENAEFWKQAADAFQADTDKGMRGWVASPAITAKMKEKGQPNFIHPYNKRDELERWL